MAEYLCDVRYNEIDYVPPTIPRHRSLVNIALYLHLFDSIIVWKDFINEQRPEIEMQGMEDYLSPRALPDLLIDALGPITVQEFLARDCEIAVKEDLEEAETDLVVVADFFLGDQLVEAYARLYNLFNLIEDLEEEEAVG